MDESLTIHTVDAVELRLAVAGVGSRSYAFIIDWHIRFIAAAAWALAALGLLAFTGLGEGGGQPTFIFAVVVPAALVYFGYHPVLEIAQGGRTPGKRMAGLRIVAADGSAPGAGALVIRNLFRLVDALPAFYGIGLVMLVISKRHVRIGDIAAGTLVVNESAVIAPSAEALLAGRVQPQTALLADELLRRWNELEPEPRLALARKLLASAGQVTDSENDTQLRAALRHLLAP